MCCTSHHETRESSPRELHTADDVTGELDLALVVVVQGLEAHSEWRCAAMRGGDHAWHALRGLENQDGADSRDETTMTAFRNIYSQSGLQGFYKGTAPKMVESASKGAVLIYSKELIMESCSSLGVGSVASGFIAGAGGGVCQTVVMGPCTFLVTAVVTGDKQTSVTQAMSKTWREKGIVGFYPGGVAIAFRQASNWASRQGFTDAVRSRCGYGCTTTRRQSSQRLRML